MIPTTVEHLPADHTFVARLPEGQAVLTYHMQAANVMDIESTYVPGPARGRGVGAALVETALSHARARGWEVIPSCWYVGAWLTEHPEYRDLIRR